MDEIKNINRNLKTVKDPVIRQRLLIVKASFKEPLREVAQIFNCTHGTVGNWKNRYKKQGLRGLFTVPRSGRPKKITKEQETKLKKKIRRHNPKKGWTTKMIREEIKEKTGVKYSSRQVIRIAQRWGTSQITPRKRYAASKEEDREEFIKKTRDSSQEYL